MKNLIETEMVHIMSIYQTSLAYAKFFIDVSIRTIPQHNTISIHGEYFFLSGTGVLLSGAGPKKR